jgi:hypothetical protein
MGLHLGRIDCFNFSLPNRAMERHSVGNSDQSSPDPLAAPEGALLQHVLMVPTTEVFRRGKPCASDGLARRHPIKREPCGGQRRVSRRFLRRLSWPSNRSFSAPALPTREKVWRAQRPSTDFWPRWPIPGDRDIQASAPTLTATSGLEPEPVSVDMTSLPEGANPLADVGHPSARRRRYAPIHERWRGCPAGTFGRPPIG